MSLAGKVMAEKTGANVNGANVNGANANPPAKTPRIVHPLFFALFPLWSLYANNVAEIPLVSLARPTIVLLSGVLLLWLLMWGIIRDNKRAALIVTALVFLFFSYGHVLETMRDAHGLAGQIGRNRFLLPLWLLLFGAALWAALRTRRDLTNINSFLNLMAGACLGLALAQSASGFIQHQRIAVTAAPRQSEPGPVTTAPATVPATVPAPTAPDIYYIILDGYGRADVLRDLYGYDNSPFLRQLAKRGFYIASRSRSNYSQTALSLSSSLNLTYLDAFAQRAGRSTERGALFKMIQENRVAAFLRHKGYKVVCVTSGADWVAASGAVFIKAGSSTTTIEELLFDITPLAAFHQASAFRYNQHRYFLSYALDRLASLRHSKTSPGREASLDRETPLFVFAHILAPHPPFVWDENGAAVNPPRPFISVDGPHSMDAAGREEYRRHYRGQLAHLNTRVLAAVDGILAHSRRRPVIIIQGDHGPGMGLRWDSSQPGDTWERLSILNALYLPDDYLPKNSNENPYKPNLYEKISPVNTFRMVFNRYFGATYPLLEDRSYYSPWQQPYAFVEIPEKQKPASRQRHPKR